MTREVSTSRFGTISVEEEAVFRFPKGIPGFESHKEWVFLGDDNNPVKWMQSLSDGSVALPVAPPGVFWSRYQVRFADADLAELGAASPSDLAFLLILSIPPSAPWDMTANLRAPLVVDQVRKVAFQLISLNEEYGVRHPVFGEEARSVLKAQALEGVAPSKTGASAPPEA